MRFITVPAPGRPHAITQRSMGGMRSTPARRTIPISGLAGIVPCSARCADRWRRVWPQRPVRAAIRRLMSRMPVEGCGRMRIVWISGAGVLLLTAAVVSGVAPGIGAGAQDAPPIVARAQWGAKAADTSLMKKQTPREIIIHHTSVRQQPKLSLEKKLQGLQTFSQKPGSVAGHSKPVWGDIPYHYYIDVSGRIGEARDVN